MKMLVFNCYVFWLGWLVAGTLLWELEFDSGLVPMGFWWIK